MEDTESGDLDELRVDGEGFEPATDIVVAQCSAAAAVGDSMTDVCDMSGHTPALSDAAGTFEAQLTVRSVIGVGTRVEAVCPGDRCAVGAANLADMTIVSLAPIEWSPDVQIAAAPVLSILTLELDRDENEGTAAVSGSGFVPGSEVNLVQCPIARSGVGVDAGDCLYEYGTPALADERGEVQVDMAVYPRFQRSSGELIDCVEDPSICAVADPWPGESGNRLSVTSFASSAG